MRSTRRLIAFTSGLLLYCAAMWLGLTVLDGWLQQLVRPYFTSYANRLMSCAGGVALVVFVISVAWCFMTVRVPQGSRQPTTSWCLAGIGTAAMGWLMAGVLHLAVVRSDTTLTVVDMLLLPTTPPLWGPLNGVAVLLGALVAGMLARRLAPPQRRSRSALRAAAA